MLANTYEIRRGAQQFAFAADGMRQKAKQVEQLDSYLADQWKGHASDAFHQVAERLTEDIQTASDALERAYSALDTLAIQLDQSNHLYQQAEQLNSQIQSLEWSLQDADEKRRSALSGEIAGLIYRKNSLENEAQSIEYQANAGASTVFDDIASMVNRLNVIHVTAGNATNDSSVIDKVRHFFSGLWNSAEQDFEKVKSTLEEEKQEVDQFAVEHPLIGGQIGFEEGALEAVWDTLKASWDTTLMVMGLEPQKEMKLTKEIFHGVAHPAQTAENLLEGAKILFSTVTQSFDDEVIHGNSFTANKWLGYASVMIAQALATDGEGGATYVARATGLVRTVPRVARKLGSKLVVKSKNQSTIVSKLRPVDEQPFHGVQETELPSNKDEVNLLSERKGEGVSKTGDEKYINPLDDPKIAKEIQSDPSAVYGYSPKPDSSLAKFEIDWTNPEEVAFARSERIKYLEKLHQKKKLLEEEVETLTEEGKTMEDIARMKVETRNKDRINSYIKAGNMKGLESMKERNLKQYGREEGPTPEQLLMKYGSWEEVIFGTVRSSPAMNVLTGLY